MVIQSLVTLAVAGMTGALFGVAYGTSIRVGYEIVFPALFKNTKVNPQASDVLSSMKTLFTGIGGLEAQNFGINQGVKNALKAMDADPELQELIKKNSNLDSQNITINLSGTSTQVSSEPSPSFRSDDVPDFSGGLAGRHRAVRDKLSGKTDAREFSTLSQEYTNVFNAFESKEGQIRQDQLERLTNVNETSVRIWGVEWKFIWFTFSLQKKLVDRVTALTPQTTDKVATVIIKLSDQQLLQKYGGVSNQTIQLELAKQKNRIIPTRNTITSMVTKIGVHGSKAQKTQLLFARQTLQTILQKVWELEHELKRRKK